MRYLLAPIPPNALLGQNTLDRVRVNSGGGSSAYATQPLVQLPIMPNKVGQGEQQQKQQQARPGLTPADLITPPCIGV